MAVSYKTCDKAVTQETRKKILECFTQQKGHSMSGDSCDIAFKSQREGEGEGEGEGGERERENE